MTGFAPRSEERIHKDIVALRPYLRPGWIMVHVPNGGNRDAKTGALMKALGAVAGVPDLLLIGPDGIARWLEVKAAKGRLSPAQTEMIGKLADSNSPTVVVRSAQEAADAMSEWGALKIQKSRGTQ